MHAQLRYKWEVIDMVSRLVIFTDFQVTKLTIVKYFIKISRKDSTVLFNIQFEAISSW